MMSKGCGELRNAVSAARKSEAEEEEVEEEEEEEESLFILSLVPTA